MDNSIKDSFKKVKQDMNTLRSELDFFREAINENTKRFSQVYELLAEINKHHIELNAKIAQNSSEIQKNAQKTDNLSISTQNAQNPAIQTDITTDDTLLKALKDQYLAFSNGNGGVPTDRQTNQQTDRHIDFTHKISKNLDSSSQNTLISPSQKRDSVASYNPRSSQNMDNVPQNLSQNHQNTLSQSNMDSIEKAANILDSLDDIKKEIRLKFKRLTEQEVLVFSTMYQLDEEVGYSDYKMLSERFNLSESSIRDYVARLIRKGIPVEKNKLNNKSVQLNISSNLKRIASLSTILQLRNL